MGRIGMSTLVGFTPATPSLAPPRADVSLNMDIGTTLELRPSVVLVASMQILALSSAELEQVIDRELAENLALERLDDSSCRACGGVLSSGCPICGEGRSRTEGTRGSQATEGAAWEVAGVPDCRDRLLEDVRLVLGREDHFVAEYLIGSLTDRGLLDDDRGAIALRLGIPVGRVQRVLATIRAVGPAGVGARDVRELLTLQLGRLAEDGVSVPVICQSLVESHLEALARGRFATIARELGTTEAAVLESRDFIRDRVRPYIAWEMPGDHPQAVTPTPTLLPDVVIQERVSEPGEYDIEVVEAARFALRVDPTYESALDRSKIGAGSIRRSPSSITGRTIGESMRMDLSDHEQRDIRSHVGRARFFLSRLRERWDTLLRVTSYIVDRQRDFLREGPAALQPLTRLDVAAALRLHESTVSRATGGKFAMLPSGKTIPFRDFFDAATPAREQLRQIIAAEDRPLSDAELARRMEEFGFRLARRTITKYRQRLDVLPRALR